MSPEKPTTSAKENRRTSKPLMEKKRRARINECLVQLKTLVLEAMKKDSSRHSKLEKADILEMTVRHLRNLHRQYLAVAISSDPNIVNKYRAGFNECANEVTRFLNGVEGMDTSIKTNILNHLANSLQNSASNSVLNTASSVGPSHSQQVSLQPVQVQIPTLATIPISPMGLTSNLATLSPTAAAASQSPEPNNNTASATLPAGVTIPDPQTLARMYGGLRFIPGTGEIALVLPNQGHLSSQIPVIPVYANAVTSACSSLAVHSTAAATSSSPAATITSAAASAGSASTSNSTKTNTMISPKNLDSIANNSSSTLTLKLPNFSMGNNLGFMRSAEVASSESSSSSKTIAIPHLRGANLGKAVDSSMREPAQERPQPQEPERIDELEPVWRPW